MWERTDRFTGSECLSPPTIDAEYVFVFSNTVTIFKFTLINDYLLIINSIMRSKSNFGFICDV